MVRRDTVVRLLPVCSRRRPVRSCAAAAEAALWLDRISSCRASDCVADSFCLCEGLPRELGVGGRLAASPIAYGICSPTSGPQCPRAGREAHASLPTAADQPIPIHTSQRWARSWLDPGDRHFVRPEQTLRRICPYRPVQT